MPLHFLLKAIVTIVLFLCTVHMSAAQTQDTLFVQFEFNESGITPASAHTLDSMLQIAEPSVIRRIDLYGHCDFKGTHAYNDSLSQARIASVRKYLSAKGLPDSLFHTETAFGKRRPLRHDKTDAARAINRRVELVLQMSAPPVAHYPPTITERMKDTALKTGNRLVLENMNFEGGRHYLLPESIPVLEDLLRALKENPTVVIEIQGHVCCTDPHEDGLDIDLGTNDLSVQRARAIYNYLVQNGIEPARLQYRGFGGSRKIYPYELTETERSKNRRVEIRIVNR